MSITLKIVDLLDKFKVQHYFIEKDNKAYFTPMMIKFNPSQLEFLIEKFVSVDGNAYKMNDLEEKVLRELDF
jgi:hypothetical protein